VSAPEAILHGAILAALLANLALTYWQGAEIESIAKELKKRREAKWKSP